MGATPSTSDVNKTVPDKPQVNDINNTVPDKPQVNDIDATKAAIDIKVEEINRILNDNTEKRVQLMNYIMEKLKNPDSNVSVDQSSEKPSVKGGSKKKIRNTRNRRNRRNRRNTKKR